MKKFMILLLSLAVLFGFAACSDGSDSGSQSLQDLAVVSLAITAGPDTYFAGETFDINDYTVVATRANGDTFTVEASDLDVSGVAIPSSGVTSATTTSTSLGKIKYSGIYTMTSTSASVDVYATVYNLDAIDVEVKANQARYYVGSDTSDIADDYTVTAYALETPATDTAADALYSRVLASDEFEVTSSQIESDAFKAAGMATLTFKANANDSAAAITDGSNTASLVVYNDYLVSFDVTTEDATKTSVIGAKTTATPMDYVVVTYTMASGKTGDTAATGATAATAAWAASITGGTTVFESGKTYEITVTAKTGVDAKDESKTVTLTPVANTITSFVLTGDAVTSGATQGDELTGTDFTVTATWLDEDATKPADVTAAVLQQNLRFNGNASYTVPEDYPASTELPVVFTLANYPNATCDTTISTASV